MNNNKGFTLVEVVIVLSVMALLALAALPRLINIVAQARQGQAYEIMAKLQSEVHLAHLGWDCE